MTSNGKPKTTQETTDKHEAFANGLLSERTKAVAFVSERSADDAALFEIRSDLYKVSDKIKRLKGRALLDAVESAELASLRLYHWYYTRA